ncbi:MAG: trehalose-6-phosphate synthase, partial [Pseudomonadota bacterium]
PVMHNRLDLAVFNSAYFETYASINARFAETVFEQSQPGDLIWVHDYHFFLLAKRLKALGWTQPCGFFLHIPFPAPEVFRAIPDHKDLAEGLCAYDVIGLQTTSDVENLSRYLEEEFTAERLDADTLKVNGQVVRLTHCPVGIDVDGFSAAAIDEPATKAAEKLERFTGHRDLVIGVDRMDYSKGLPQRFEGMATLFDQYPDLHGTISFTQIAPPSRSVVGEYVQLRQQLDELSGRINGDYGDLDWIPIRYLARGYPREEIAGLYRLAKVALVTPLQDGMNLVAKEYVAAQDPEDPGVLILSQFAGAAEQMSEALIINPHDNQAVAEAVREALTMPKAERKRRWRKLYDGIAAEDIGWWRQRFLQTLKDAGGAA